MKLLVAGGAGNEHVPRLARVAQAALLGQRFFLSCCLLLHAGVLAAVDAFARTVPALLPIAVYTLQHGLAPRGALLADADCTCTCGKHGCDCCAASKGVSWVDIAISTIVMTLI